MRIRLPELIVTKLLLETGRDGDYGSNSMGLLALNLRRPLKPIREIVDDCGSERAATRGRRSLRRARSGRQSNRCKENKDLNESFAQRKIHIQVYAIVQA